MSNQDEYNNWFRYQLTNLEGSRFGEIEEREHEGRSYLGASIEHSDPRRVIMISNFGGEITIAIDTHHAHFDHESKATRAEDFAEAINWVKDIIEGRVYVCTKYRGEKLLSSLSTYDLGSLVLNAGEHAEVLCYPESGVSRMGVKGETGG